MPQFFRRCKSVFRRVFSKDRFYQNYVQGDDILNQGACGHVFRASKLIKNGSTCGEYDCIVKELKHAPLIESFITTELEISRTVSHPNIIKFIETIDSPRKVRIVMEECKSGDLIEKIEAGLIDEMRAKNIFKQITLGLQSLHSRSFIHCDLKPEHILFKDSDTIRIIDFGLSQNVEKFKKCFLKIGTTGYQSPEMLAGKGYDKSTDIWALGIILFVLVYHFNPFSVRGDKKYIDRLILRGFVPEDRDGFGPFFPNRSSCSFLVSQELKNLISGILTTDVTKRLTIEEILDSEWLKA